MSRDRLRYKIVSIFTVVIAVGALVCAGVVYTVGYTVGFEDTESNGAVFLVLNGNQVAAANGKYRVLTEQYHDSSLELEAERAVAKGYDWPYVLTAPARRLELLLEREPGREVKVLVCLDRTVSPEELAGLLGGLPLQRVFLCTPDHEDFGGWRADSIEQAFQKAAKALRNRVTLTEEEAALTRRAADLAEAGELRIYAFRVKGTAAELLELSAMEGVASVNVHWIENPEEFRQQYQEGIPYFTEEPLLPAPDTEGL